MWPRRGPKTSLRHGPLSAGDFFQAERKRLLAEAARLRTELGWMQATAAWRWRERLVGGRWLRSFYRAVLRRR